MIGTQQEQLIDRVRLFFIELIFFVLLDLYKTQKKSEPGQKEKELTQKIEELEHNVTSNKNEHLEYQQLKSEWESIQRNKSNGIIIRSRAKWVEYGEKN